MASTASGVKRPVDGDMECRTFFKQEPPGDSLDTEPQGSHELDLESVYKYLDSGLFKNSEEESERDLLASLGYGWDGDGDGGEGEEECEEGEEEDEKVVTVEGLALSVTVSGLRTVLRPKLQDSEAKFDGFEFYLQEKRLTGSLPVLEQCELIEGAYEKTQLIDIKLMIDMEMKRVTIIDILKPPDTEDEEMASSSSSSSSSTVTRKESGQFHPQAQYQQDNIMLPLPMALAVSSSTYGIQNRGYEPMKRKKLIGGLTKKVNPQAELAMAVDSMRQVISPTASAGNRQGNNGQVQLWQFLLELLTDADCRAFIRWEGCEGEFKLIDPERVAHLWGQRKGKSNMNYEKLSRALRYYYDGDMISKVTQKRFAYQFVCDLKSILGYDAAELDRLVSQTQLKRAASRGYF